MCGGDMIWASLVGAPFHEKAITEAQHHSENQDSVMVTDPAAVVVVGDIQALMQTLSMPQAARLRRSQFAASRREDSRLVISAAGSSLRPSV